MAITLKFKAVQDDQYPYLFSVFGPGDWALDGSDVVPPHHVLLRLSGSGAGKSSGFPQRKAALLAILRAWDGIVPQTRILWYQQGPVETENPVLPEHPGLPGLSERLDRGPLEMGLEFGIANGHPKWLGLKVPDGTDIPAALTRLKGHVESLITQADPNGTLWTETDGIRGHISPSSRQMARQAFGPGEDPEPEHAADATTVSSSPSPFTSLLARSLNVILEGVPGTGKSHAIRSLAASRYGNRMTVIVMHPAIGYEDLIEGIRPAGGGSPDGANLRRHPGNRQFHASYGPSVAGPQVEGKDTGFAIRAGQFLLACAKACATPAEDHLVVLDEINRCNVPRALGELLLLMEPSKRAHWDAASGTWKVEEPALLPCSGLEFFVPDNLHILGTMNTTDRSIAPLDQALRRRFIFHRLLPMAMGDLLNALKLGDDNRVVFSNALEVWVGLNEWLGRTLGPDLMLGHSYFFDAARLTLPTRQGLAGLSAVEALTHIFQFALLPQLVEILNMTNQLTLLDSEKLGFLKDYLGKMGLSLPVSGEGLWRSAQVCSGDPREPTDMAEDSAE